MPTSWGSVQGHPPSGLCGYCLPCMKAGGGGAQLCSTCSSSMSRGACSRPLPGPASLGQLQKDNSRQPPPVTAVAGTLPLIHFIVYLHLFALE